MASAFISHASPDREVAERICTFLEERGIRCWIAPRDVRPGRKYGEEIVDGINGADAVVLVLTEHANKSLFVEREIERAVSYGKPTLPVRVREVQPSRGLELFISDAHWIDAWKPPMEQYLDRLADSIRSFSPDAGGVTETKRKAMKIGWRGKRLAKRIAITTAILFLLGVGATATWWLLGRERSTSSNQAISYSTPAPTAVPAPAPSIVPLPSPAIASTKPAAPPQNTPQEKPAPSLAPVASVSASVEQKQETPAQVAAEARPSATPSANVADVLTSLGSTTGPERDAAIQQNSKRLPPEITTDDLLAITSGCFDRENVIRRLSNKLPNPIKVEDALRILGETTSQQRTILIEILSPHFPPAITVNELMALIEGVFNRSGVINRLLSRLPEPLSMEESLRILDETNARERLGLIEMLGLRLPQKLSVADLLKIIEGTFDRNGAIRQLVSRLQNPLPVEEVLQILDSTSSRERSDLIEMLNPRFPGKLSTKEMLSAIEGAFDRNGMIRLQVNRLPNPLPIDEVLEILGSTTSRERTDLIEILTPHLPRKLSVKELLAMIENAFDRNGLIRLQVNRLPNPIEFEDLRLLLGQTNSRERYDLIDILHSRVPTGLSSAQISELVEGSFDPVGAEKMLRR